MSLIGALAHPGMRGCAPGQTIGPDGSCAWAGSNPAAGKAAAEPEYLSEWSPRDKPWDGHRADADQIAKMYGAHPEFQNLGGRVSLCSLWLGFAWAPERLDPSVQTLKLREARFCRVRHCPICQW